jgi:uncharacterized protein YndB with AHSA1/START domain
VSRDAVVHEVVYPHPIGRVWRALTDSAARAKWLMPNNFEPRVGHCFTFRTEPQPGWSGIVECEVAEIEKPRRLSYTWRGDPSMPETLVVFTLEPVKEGTRLHLAHSRFGAGGPAGTSIRDLLGSGWGTKLLRVDLPALLDHRAADSVEEEV